MSDDFIETIWAQYAVETEEHIEGIEALFDDAGGFRLFLLFHGRSALVKAPDDGARRPDEAAVRQREQPREEQRRRDPPLVAAEVGPAEAQDGGDILHGCAVILERREGASNSLRPRANKVFPTFRAGAMPAVKS